MKENLSEPLLSALAPALPLLDRASQAGGPFSGMKAARPCSAEGRATAFPRRSVESTAEPFPGGRITVAVMARFLRHHRPATSNAAFPRHSVQPNER